MSRLFNDTNVVVAVAIGAAHRLLHWLLRFSSQLKDVHFECVYLVFIVFPLQYHRLYSSIVTRFSLQFRNYSSRTLSNHTTLTNCIRQNRLNVHIDTIKWNEFRRHSIAVSFSLFSHWGSQTTKGVKTITRDNKNEAKKNATAK